MFADLLAAIEVPQDSLSELTPEQAEQPQPQSLPASSPQQTTLPRQLAPNPLAANVEVQVRRADPQQSEAPVLTSQRMPPSTSAAQPVLWVVNPTTPQEPTLSVPATKPSRPLQVPPHPQQLRKPSEALLANEFGEVQALSSVPEVDQDESAGGPDISSELPPEEWIEPTPDANEKRQESVPAAAAVTISQPAQHSVPEEVLRSAPNVRNPIEHNQRSQDVAAIRPRGPEPLVDAFQGSITRGSPKHEQHQISLSRAPEPAPFEVPPDYAAATKSVEVSSQGDFESPGDSSEPAAPIFGQSSASALWAPTNDTREIASSSRAQDAPPVQEPQSIRMAPQPPPAATGPVKRLTVSIPGESNTRTDIHFVERNGSLNLDVRTTRPEVAENLQRELPDLVRALDTNGYRSEMQASTDFGGDALSSAEALGLTPKPEADHEGSFDNTREEERGARDWHRGSGEREGQRQRRQQQERYEDELYAN